VDVFAAAALAGLLLAHGVPEWPVQKERLAELAAGLAVALERCLDERGRT
jgi:hypothetical protein